MDMFKECFDMSSALFPGLSFMLHQGSEGMHLRIDGFDGGILLEESISSHSLLRGQFLRRLA